MNGVDAAARPRILLADDNPDFRNDMEILLGREFDLRTSASVAEAATIYQDGWPDLVLLDIEFPAEDGLEALAQLHDYNAAIPIIMLTSHTDYRLAVDAMHRGAHTFIGKDQQPAVLLETVRATLRHTQVLKRSAYLEQRLEKIRGTDDSLLLGPSVASQRLAEEIDRAASVDVGVLLVGETGSGKELVARLIHQKSGRSKGPFDAVEIYAEPDTLIASKLFGHEPGAFTGASTRRIGAFEGASGGSLLLDEVGEIPLPVQTSLLRVLQYKKVSRLGSHGGASVYCDVRIMAATHRDLEDLVAQGRFREDLYHRLRILTIRVPPLRERREDIPMLGEHFIEKNRVSTGSKVVGLSPAALHWLSERPWRGNVREFEFTLTRAMIRACGEMLEVKHLQEQESGATRPVSVEGEVELLSYHTAKDALLTTFKRDYIHRALDLADGVVNQAARLANLPQPSFRKMMKDLKIKRTGEPSDS